MRCLAIGLTAFSLLLTALGTQAAPARPRIRIGSDVVIYSDDRFYSSFPSIARRRDGELLVAFRRAPERRAFGEKGVTHTDANSYLVMVRSADAGQTWSERPELIYANPFGGSQDPCMVQLRDGSLLCTSYGWAYVQTDAIAKLKDSVHYGNYVFLGGFLVRSENGGRTWSDAIIPASCQGETARDLRGQPIPAYNRGAICEGRDGRLYWAVASNTSTNSKQTEVHLMISEDKGRNWRYSCPIARNDAFSINETSLYQTPNGDLVAFMRTEGFNDHTIVARSTDRGARFSQWIDAGFQGHPHYALQLPDQRVLLVYGYRHKPFGIRARVLDPECTQFDGMEVVIREDGGNGDLGYPWATMISKNRALVVYYFNKDDKTRHIAGTFLEIE
jgi:hypothetical protein